MNAFRVYFWRANEFFSRHSSKWEISFPLEYIIFEILTKTPILLRAKMGRASERGIGQKEPHEEEHVCLLIMISENVHSAKHVFLYVGVLLEV